MNLKLNNDNSQPPEILQPEQFSSAEERRRTGRYVAILVGISLVCLAIYHAWVRKVPVLASLLVPALIMLLYIAWVLYTASRDKKKALDAELGLQPIEPLGLIRRPVPRSTVAAPVVLSPANLGSASTPELCKAPPQKKPPITERIPKETPSKTSTTPRDPNKPKEFRRCYSIA